jgi:flagellar hook-length control protein FliK
MVASVLPRPGEAAMPAAVANAEPLLSAAPKDGVALAGKLQGTLTQSGLFYESHQAEWVSGKRDLAVLMREPQTRLEAQARAEPQQRAESQGRIAPSAQTAQAALPIASPAAPNTAAAGVALTRDLALPAAATRSEQAMPPALQALVQQQLAALETGKLVFQLQVWPDQWMQWEIDEDAQNASAQSADAAAPPRIQTRLHLDLPRLGALDATLTFDGAGVHMRLDAAQASSAAVLQDNRASLRAALNDAGLPAVDIAVARHG